MTVSYRLGIKEQSNISVSCCLYPLNLKITVQTEKEKKKELFEDIKTQLKEGVVGGGG